MRHEANDRENNKSSEYACCGVYTADNNGVSAKEKVREETSCKTLPERQEAKGGQAEDEAYPLGRWQRAPQLRGDTEVGLPDSL